MSKREVINRSRRKLLRGTATGLASVSVAGILPLSRAFADHHEMQKLDENATAAVALGYKHDATQVDTNKFPARAGSNGAQQFCYNCNLYLADEKAEWGGCRIFPGKLVNGKGWCAAWVRR